DDVGRMPRVRLLAEDVLPGLERPHRPFVVEAVREADVDDLDIRIVEEPLVRAMSRRHAMLGRESPRPIRVAAADGHEPGARGVPDVPEEPVVDPAGAEDAPAHGLGHRIASLDDPASSRSSSVRSGSPDWSPIAATADA